MNGNSPGLFFCVIQMHAAISQDRQDIAVAGTRGLAVYSRRARRWRLFGDATQERSIQVSGSVGRARLLVDPGRRISCCLQGVVLADGAGIGAPLMVICPPAASKGGMFIPLHWAAVSRPSPNARPPHPSLQVHGLMWLPGGVIAAVAHVEGGGRGQEAASPQLLLYPQYHLDSASLLARMPLPQVGAGCTAQRVVCSHV